MQAGRDVTVTWLRNLSDCGRERIRRCMEEAAEAEGTPVAAVSLMERAHTIRALPMSTAKAGSEELLQAPSSCSPVRDNIIAEVLPLATLKPYQSLILNPCFLRSCFWTPPAAATSMITPSPRCSCADWGIINMRMPSKLSNAALSVFADRKFSGYSYTPGRMAPGNTVFSKHWDDNLYLKATGPATSLPCFALSLAQFYFRFKNPFFP